MSQHVAQHQCDRQYGFILQQMDKPTQATFVFPKRHGAREFWFEVATTVAPAIAHQQLRTGQEVAAHHALRRAHRLNGVKTFVTDRNAGNAVERSTAESAIRREENRKNA